MKSRIRLVAAPGLFVSLLMLAVTSAAGQTTMEWISLAQASEGFSVSMPVKPEETTERYPMMGNSYKIRLYTTLNEADGLLYMVMMQELPTLFGVLGPAERLEKFMEGFKEGIGQSFGNATPKSSSSRIESLK